MHTYRHIGHALVQTYRTYTRTDDIKDIHTYRQIHKTDMHNTHTHTHTQTEAQGTIDIATSIGG